MKALAAIVALAGLACSSAAWAKQPTLPIDSIVPAIAARGDVVTITGAGLTKRADVAVGGVAAHVLAAKGGRVTFRVPELAPTGRVVVEVRQPGGRRGTVSLRVGFDGQTEAEVDEAAAVAAPIGADGGTIQIGAATLAVPAGSVPAGTIITATPLVALEGSPFAGAPVGLKLEPSGLVLMQPATLTLPRPDGLAVAFAFDGDGTDFHLVPHRVVGDTVQVKVWHFSGAGILPARLEELATALSYEPSPAHMSAEQRIAEARLDAELNGTDPGPAIAAALRDWRLRSVQPGLQVAEETTSIPFFELAFGEWLAWNAYLQEYRDSVSAADAAGLDAGARVDRDVATVSAAAVARRALDRCTGPTLPLAAMRDVLRIAAPVRIAELPIDATEAGGERALPDGDGLQSACVDVEVALVRHAPVLARNRDNGFLVGGRVVFWSGGESVSIPLRYRLADMTGDAPVPVLDETTEGALDTTLRPTTLGIRTHELTVDLGPDTVLRTFFHRRMLDLVVRERLDLQAKRAGDFAFADTVGAVAPGDTVTLRIRLAGDDRDGKEITLTHDGPGTLPATATTNAAGEALVTYTAPAASAIELVTAGITEDGLTSGDATVITTETPVEVEISPTSATIAPGGTRQFTATVTGTADTTVTWSATGGSITTSGLFTAGTATGTFSVEARSNADPSKSATATVTVVSANVTVNEAYSLVNASARACGGSAECDEGSDRNVVPGLAPFAAVLTADAASESPPGTFEGNKALSTATAALNSDVDAGATSLEVVASGSVDGATDLTFGAHPLAIGEYRGEATGAVGFTVANGSLPFIVTGSGRATASSGLGKASYLLIRQSPFEVIRNSEGGSFDTSGSLAPGTYTLAWGAICSAEARANSASCDASFSFTFRLGA